MASLELVVDASGVIRGAADARAGLDSIIGKAGSTEDALGRLSQTTTITGASLHDTFGASRGGLQVLNGITATTSALEGLTSGSANFGQAATAAAVAAQHLSRTVGDWRNLSTAMATTTTVSKEVVRDQFGIATGMRNVVVASRASVSGLGVLWGVMKANPMFAVVTALGLVGAAMSAFSANTKAAAADWDKFQEALTKSKASALVSPGLGRTFDANAAAYNEYASQAENIQLDILQGRAKTLTRSEFAKQLNMKPGDISSEYLSIGRPRKHDYFDEPDITPESQVKALQEMARYYQGKIARKPDGSAYGPDLPPDLDRSPYSGLGPFLPNTVENAQTEGGAMAWRVERAEEKRKEAQAEQREHMREMEASAMRVSSALADGAYDLLSGLRDAKSVMASLAHDAGRALTQQAFAQGAAALFGGFNSK